MKNKTLIIDDEVDNLEILSHTLKREGHNVISAKNGKESLDIVNSRDDIILIIADILMPEMDGIEFLKAARDQHLIEDIPVIIQTASINKEFLDEGIKLGAYYYLSKPFNRKKLKELSNLAIGQYLNRHELYETIEKAPKPAANCNFDSIDFIKGVEFKFQNIEDIKDIASHLASYYPNKEKAMYGISELMINAIEHGNLGLTFEQKIKFSLKGIWKEEIFKRSSLDKNKKKFARVTIAKYEDRIKLIVKDCGNGFNYNEYLELSKDRASSPAGRGIATAKIYSFDELSYVGKGNEVIATVYTN